MSRISTFILGMIAGSALMFGALKYHVLRTESGVELVPKLTMSLDGTYLDVRTFDARDWSEHRQVLGAVVRARKEHLLKGSAAQELTEGVQGLLDGLGISGSES